MANDDPNTDATAVPYGTPQAPRIAVRGEAHLEAEPELARIGITVTARGTDRRTALDDLTHRNTTALDLVKSYGEAVEKLETGTFSITPELTKHGRGERIRTYHGRVHITAELTDFTALGELTTRLADLDLTRVDGPWWSLRPTSPIHAQARQQAVREAVQRAREYADALGTTLAALVELADIGAEGRVARFDRAMVPTSAAFAGTVDDTPAELDLEPGRQHVHAAVNARFTLHPPTL
ncbi:SIMPL domain-containing protein [Streptomyces longispororuber]|uniref:SIMPL domain-containing protein n=1 Tax=Streptomyces longispororuber TaxID=68230 RepID=UPI00210E4F5C|nr:SIMPL domain-containing protein [Streptomyces longispororuber]MCQ4213126.1 SIMPL domain-containing protein [Streptomyces longispororuber]